MKTNSSWRLEDMLHATTSLTITVLDQLNRLAADVYVAYVLGCDQARIQARYHADENVEGHGSGSFLLFVFKGKLDDCRFTLAAQEAWDKSGLNRRGIRILLPAGARPRTSGADEGAVQGRPWFAKLSIHERVCAFAYTWQRVLATAGVLLGHQTRPGVWRVNVLALQQMLGDDQLLNVDDDFNREGLGIEVDFSLQAGRVTRALDQIIEWRGKPACIRCDNGPEYIGKTMLQWAVMQRITLIHTQPGNPQQNAYVECYNRTVRYDWLAQNLFNSLDEVQLGATA